MGQQRAIRKWTMCSQYPEMWEWPASSILSAPRNSWSISFDVYTVLCSMCSIRGAGHGNDELDNTHGIHVHDRSSRVLSDRQLAHGSAKEDSLSAYLWLAGTPK
jgi:hypothetical protein